jgi:hypothetical protein
VISYQHMMNRALGLNDSEVLEEEDGTDLGLCVDIPFG